MVTLIGKDILYIYVVKVKLFKRKKKRKRTKRKEERKSPPMKKKFKFLSDRICTISSLRWMELKNPNKSTPRKPIGISVSLVRNKTYLNVVCIIFQRTPRRYDYLKERYY